MRFSIRQFLSFTFTIAIAVALSVSLFRPISYHPFDHMSLGQIRNYRLSQDFHCGGHSFSDMTYEEFDRFFTEDFPSDPWGNPYVFVNRDQDGVFGMRSRKHIYSMGEDGVSRSNGDDVDDINSWSPKLTEHYDKQRLRRRFAVHFVFAAILVIPVYTLLIWPMSVFCQLLIGRRPRA